ncbi:TonB family protein [Pseudoalteromonas luteoviolacea]|uniref:TonB C-terminal domain-containing protein n=1 Tax=Pseudoalteromonas luteoviolacea S4054 TaxID=1129367 RepID=A0A0F6AEJ0_9GAMM|nr:TonB family protein [Pseudoalteromonas luteoviolacea]AOT10348.1 hypothetical protein S4054249_20940 [Pseudoalteromonas luteoviolacea]AOT15583.1 hypothetical protein S40542_22650 [Pseudoalteromonas luteoviolacea]AOT20166.1 hypothetical protein S4054_20855 [Pseudoalteromonas luteoviolacea]KKE84610.1 hypothetical protein N479_08575 [Pseudoalteromonas luteoviolacea S4054]KZN71245.1 hypothetical protein N481_18845 [Pseudoalteromonas luteoviolacea S4047-1]
MKHVRPIELIILILALFSTSSRADLFTATQYYQQQNYVKAYDEFYQLAQLGNGDAIYNLAVMSLHGQGTEKNLSISHAWFSIAAEYGIAEALRTAHIISSQYADQQVLDQALQQRKSQFGYQYLSDKYQPDFSKAKKHPQSSERTFDKQPDYPEQAARQGIEGWVWLEFDIDTTGVVKNITVIDDYPKNIFTSSLINAVKVWRYKPGKAKKNHSLIYHFTTYKGKEYKRTLAFQQQDYKAQIRRHIDAAEQGNALVQYYIANWLSSNEYNASRLLKYHWRDDNDYLTILLAAAKNNLPVAQYKLAVELLTNTHDKKQFDVALNWLKRSALHFSPAQYKLATLYGDKHSQLFAPYEATKWFKRSAPNDKRAAKALSLHLFKHPSDEENLSQWLTVALEQDENDPELLLLQAKLTHSTNKSKSIKIAQNALKQAKKRQWDTSQIEQFISKL